LLHFFTGKPLGVEKAETSASQTWLTTMSSPWS